jgi:hypothetical protein
MARVKWLPAVQWFGEGKRQKVLENGESGVTPPNCSAFRFFRHWGRDLGGIAFATFATSMYMV